MIKILFFFRRCIIDTFIKNLQKKNYYEVLYPNSFINNYGNVFFVNSKFKNYF